MNIIQNTYNFTKVYKKNCWTEFALRQWQYCSLMNQTRVSHNFNNHQILQNFNISNTIVRVRTEHYSIKSFPHPVCSILFALNTSKIPIFAIICNWNIFQNQNVLSDHLNCCSRTFSLFHIRSWCFHHWMERIQGLVCKS